MLACMCDIIIAAESTRIWYPSLCQTGTGTEVMVLPFEISFRKAKEYLWTGDPIPIREAERLGMVNRVVADSQLEAETLRLAERIALTPPVAARLVKRSLNHMQDLMGMTAGLDYHFLIHQIGHATSESTAWFAEARRRTKEMGFEKGFLEFRDGSYEEQSKKGYQ